MARTNNTIANAGKENKRRKKTRQGNGRGTKFNTRVGSKRFKKENKRTRKMNWNEISMIIYFNFVPVALIAFGSWVLLEFVKYEHRRLNRRK